MNRNFRFYFYLSIFWFISLYVVFNLGKESQIFTNIERKSINSKNYPNFPSETDVETVNEDLKVRSRNRDIIADFGISDNLPQNDLNIDFYNPKIVPENVPQNSNQIDGRTLLGDIPANIPIPYDNLGNQIHPNVYIHGDDKSDPKNRFFYNHTTPIVFIGGMPRSGTTLMRVMLDAHPKIRCGEETRVIPKILGIRNQWYKSEKERNRLKLAGVNDLVVDEALRQFILEVVVRHGTPAEHLCNKDPFTLKSQNYLKKLFPNAKFILMLRDGRATAHSIIERHVTITGFDLTSYRDVLTKWNKSIGVMYDQCLEHPTTCLPVKYEQLVLHPESNLRKIANFLNIEWNDNMLHHDKLMNDKKKVSLSDVEPSTNQVKKPLYLDALTAWHGNIPQDVLDDIRSIAPMIGRLGYKYDMGPKPSYGEPDEFVRKNLEQAGQSFNHDWNSLNKKGEQ